MAQVNLRINGYTYRVWCADGEEDKLAQLAAEIDRRITVIRSQGGSFGEAQSLVMGALMLADELEDLKREAPATPVAAPPPPDREAAARIVAVARRLEDVAARLADA